MITNCSLSDINTIFKLYEQSTNLQRRVFPDTVWPEFDREMVEQEIIENRQWKITLEKQVACVWATTFSDPKIWEEKDSDPSIYIHRIATNPDFRGQQFVKQIVKWATAYAISNKKQYIRLDTCGRNEKLIKHYTSCGFTFLGIHKLKDANGLPAHYIDADVCFFEMKLKDD